MQNPVEDQPVGAQLDSQFDSSFNQLLLEVRDRKAADRLRSHLIAMYTQLKTHADTLPNTDAVSTEPWDKLLDTKIAKPALGRDKVAFINQHFVESGLKDKKEDGKKTTQADVYNIFLPKKINLNGASVTIPNWVLPDLNRQLSEEAIKRFKLIQEVFKTIGPSGLMVDDDWSLWKWRKAGITGKLAQRMTTGTHQPLRDVKRRSYHNLIAEGWFEMILLCMLDVAGNNPLEDSPVREAAEEIERQLQGEPNSAFWSIPQTGKGSMIDDGPCCFVYLIRERLTPQKVYYATVNIDDKPYVVSAPFELPEGMATVVDCPGLSPTRQEAVVECMSHEGEPSGRVATCYAEVDLGYGQEVVVAPSGVAAHTYVQVELFGEPQMKAGTVKGVSETPWFYPVGRIASIVA